MTSVRPTPPAGPGGGGARRAAPRPRSGNRTAVPALLLLALAVALVLVAPTGPAAEPAAPGPAGLPVGHLLLGCPGATPETDWRPEVRVGSAPVTTSSDGTSVRVTSAEGQRPVEVARGELADVPVDRDGLTLEVDEAAAGLFAVQAGGARRMLTAARCLAPAATWWFSAAGGTLAHSSELVIDNLDPGPAVLDVRVLGPGGPVETVGSRGLTVPPGERLVLPLTELAPQGEQLTVSVTATRGRVVAAVADRFAERLGAEPGSAWLPAQTAPRRVHRLPGLVAGAGHLLVVANPGANEALVDLQVSGESGSFTPTGETQLRVPPGEVVTQDVSGLLPEEAGALVVRSSVPVLSTVRASTRTDTTYLADPGRLTGPAAATVGPGADTMLTLVTGKAGGSATVTSYDDAGAEVDTATVELGPGATARSTPARRAAYLVVTPQRGSVQGTVTWSRRSGVAVLPLVEVPLRVRRPVVEPAYEGFQSAS